MSFSANCLEPLNHDTVLHKLVIMWNKDPDQAEKCLIKLLIGGANLNQTNCDGLTPLHLAI